MSKRLGVLKRATYTCTDCADGARATETVTVRIFGRLQGLDAVECPACGSDMRPLETRRGDRQ